MTTAPMLNWRTSPSSTNTVRASSPSRSRGSRDADRPCRKASVSACTEASFSWTRRLWPEPSSVPSRVIERGADGNAAFVESEDGLVVGRLQHRCGQVRSSGAREERHRLSMLQHREQRHVLRRYRHSACRPADRLAERHVGPGAAHHGRHGRRLHGAGRRGAGRRSLAPYDVDIVATVATMGIPVAVEVTRHLGLDQYVVLHKTPKIHLADAVSEQVRSITTDADQRLLFDRARIKDVAGSSRGHRRRRDLHRRLDRGHAAPACAVWVLMSWRSARSSPRPASGEAHWARTPRWCGRSAPYPVFRPDGTGGLVEDWNG